MQPADSETKKDLRAAAHTARELGPEYENEVMDGFLRRLQHRMDAQPTGRPLRAPEPAAPARRGGGGNAFQYVSLVVAVPLSAIGASLAGLPGLVIAWAGIVALNFVQLRGQRSAEERSRSQRRGDDWD
jgi:hypothetical protein